MTQRGLDIATKFMQREAQKGFPYDTIREAGEKDGFEYYHYFCAELLHHKLGRPNFVKVHVSSGRARQVRRLDEINWAMGQEIQLNRL